MRTVRPKNLNIFTIRFPLPAIVSILHRISGIILFLFIPVFLALLKCSLTYTGFENISVFFSQPIVKFICWLCLLPFLYHLFAGIRHLLGDIHIGTTLAGGRLSAKLVFVVFILSAIFVGVWLC